jgi:hypothetical protein
VGKIGVPFGIWTGETKDLYENFGMTIEIPPGVGFGIDVGAAYYFTATIGAFVEAGFDRYGLSAKAKYAGGSDTLDAPFNRFLTFGISTKF